MPFCPECRFDLRAEWKNCPKCGAANPLFVEGSSSEPAAATIRRKGSEYAILRLGDLPSGFVVDGRYEVVRKLGQGGFGAVYLARDRKMAIPKALKVIPDMVVNDAEAMSDLRHEAQTLVSLNHPNIVRAFDLHDSGRIKFIDMEYVEGKTLAELKIERADRKLPEADVIEYGLQIAEALAYGNSKGVLHKDIKPQNIMLGPDGVIKVMDFGIAETVRSSMTKLTGTSSSGTLVYMSPEQLRGKDVRKESDIYSFGAMLYELLSGHPPFWRGNVEYQVLHEEPPDMPGVSPLLNALVRQCLKKQFTERPRSFDQVHAMLSDASAPSRTGSGDAITQAPVDTAADRERVEAESEDAGRSGPPILAPARNTKRIIAWSVVAMSIVVAVVLWNLGRTHRSAATRVQPAPGSTTVVGNVPALIGRVNDYAEILGPTIKQLLEEKLARVEARTGAQIAVLTIPTLGDESLDAFSIKVAEAWKLGRASHNDGMLITLVRNDRQVRIEVGTGLETTFPDELCGVIIREEMLPQFRVGNYGEGLRRAVDRIAKTIP